MALTITNITSGDVTTDPTVSASITPASTDVILVSFGVTTLADGVDPGDSYTVSGCNLTWTEVGTARIGTDRRRCFVFRGSGASPTTGSVTMDYTGAQTFVAIMYSIDRVTGADLTTPVSNVATNTVASGTSLAITVGGTVDSGDFVFAGFQQTAGSNLTEEAGLTVLVEILGAGGEVRALMTAYDGTPAIDQTPSISWTGATGAAGVAFIVEVASGVEAPSPTIPASPLVGNLRW